MARTGRLPPSRYYARQHALTGTRMAKMHPRFQGRGNSISQSLGMDNSGSPWRYRTPMIPAALTNSDESDTIAPLNAVEAMGKISESAIFPFIGPHRLPDFLLSKPSEEALSGVRLREGGDKRNIGSVARSGLLEKLRRPPRFDMFSEFSDDGGDEENDEVECDENIVDEALEKRMAPMAKIAGKNWEPKRLWRPIYRRPQRSVPCRPVADKRSISTQAKNGWLKPHVAR